LTDANQSKSSLAEQNKLLHAQLERANNELRRAHETQLLQNVGSTQEGATTHDEREHTKELDDLRSVIAYLRKENEISSSKFELAHLENDRFRVQVRALESTIERLREELKRTESSSTDAVARSADTAAKSAAQLEQLDLLRESNATLREECQRTVARLRTEEERVKNLDAQMAPLRNAETLLKAQVDSLKQEVTTLGDANKRWKQRVEQLVEKYQQVDPTEYEKVCADKVALEKQLAEIQARENTLKAELEGLKSSEGKIAEEEKGKTENLRKQYDRIKGFAKTWKNKAEALTKQLAEKSKEADDKTSLVAELHKKLAQSLSEKSALESRFSSLEAAKSDGAALTASTNALWEKERKELKSKVDADAKRIVQMKDFTAKLMTNMKVLQQENSQLKGQVTQASTTPTVASATPASQQTAVSAAPTAPAVPDAGVASAQTLPVALAGTTAKAVSDTTGAATAKMSAIAPVPVPAQVPSVPAKTPVIAPVPVPVQVSSVPAKTPVLAPAPVPVQAPSAPVAAPTLKTVTTVLNPAAKPFVAAPATTTIATKNSAHDETKEAEPSTSTAGGVNTQLSEEEKLRLTLQQSMMKKLIKKPAEAKPSVPATAPPTKPVVATSMPAAAKPPLPSQAPPPLPPSAPAEDSKPVSSNTGAAPTITTSFGVWRSKWPCIRQAWCNHTASSIVPHTDASPGCGIDHPVAKHALHLCCYQQHHRFFVSEH
jgi:hypothetical protein